MCCYPRCFGKYSKVARECSICNYVDDCRWETDPKPLRLGAKQRLICSIIADKPLAYPEIIQQMRKQYPLFTSSCLYYHMGHLKREGIVTSVKGNGVVRYMLSERAKHEIGKGKLRPAESWTSSWGVNRIFRLVFRRRQRSVDKDRRDGD